MPSVKVYADAPLHPDRVATQPAEPAFEPALEPAPEAPSEPEPHAAQEQLAPEEIPAPTRTSDLPALDPHVPPSPQPGPRSQSLTTPPRSLGMDTTPPLPRASQAGVASPPTFATNPRSRASISYIPATPTHLFVPPPSVNTAPTYTTYANAYAYAPPPLFNPSPWDSSAAHSPSPVGAESRKASLEHPPGYMQNPYAADGTAAERAKYQEAARRASEADGMLGAVRGWAASAGEALYKMEGGAWRWAGGRKTSEDV